VDSPDNPKTASGLGLLGNLESLAQSPPRVASRPFGLRPEVPYTEYLRDPVCSLSRYNYKVAAAIGENSSSLRTVLSVLDTGSGPNLVRASAVPQSLRSKIDRS